MSQCSSAVCRQLLVRKTWLSLKCGQRCLINLTLRQPGNIQNFLSQFLSAIYFRKRTFIKFWYFEKAAKNLAHLFFQFSYLVTSNYRWKMRQIFVAFPEYLNFTLYFVEEDLHKNLLSYLTRDLLQFLELSSSASQCAHLVLDRRF